MELDPNRSPIQRYFELVTRHVVALFLRDPKGGLQSCGTGFLVSASESVFLISAAHVFDNLSDKDVCFYAGERILRNVSGENRVTGIPHGKTRNDDQIDVGVFRLEGEGLPPYHDVNKVALPITALKPFAYPRECKRYLFTGFPVSKSKVNPYRRHMETRPYGTICMSASKEEYYKVGCDPKNHIVMPFSRHKVRGGNGKTRLPVQRGISGSPLWLLFGEVNENDPMQNIVVGIVTEYHEDKSLLLATDIAAAIWLINEFN